VAYPTTPARHPRHRFDPPGALNFGAVCNPCNLGRGEPLNFGHFGRGRPLNFGTLLDPNDPFIIMDDWGGGSSLPSLEEMMDEYAVNVPGVFPLEPRIPPPDIMDGPSAATDPLRVFGLTNEERTVNIALLVGGIGAAWLLFAKR